MKRIVRDQSVLSEMKTRTDNEQLEQESFEKKFGADVYHEVKNYMEKLRKSLLRKIDVGLLDDKVKELKYYEGMLKIVIEKDYEFKGKIKYPKSKDDKNYNFLLLENFDIIIKFKEESLINKLDFIKSKCDTPELIDFIKSLINDVKQFGLKK